MIFKNNHMGTSQVVQWLRLHVPNTGDPGSIPGQRTRSHIMLQVRVHVPQLRSPHTAMKSCACVCESLSRAQLCDPMDWSPPGSSVHRISQARVLEWVVIFSSRGSSWPRDRTQVCCIAGGFFTIWATREASYKGLLSSCKHVFRSDSSKWKCEAKECLFSVLMHAAKFCFSKAVPIYILMPTVHSPCLFACSSFSLALTDSFSNLPQVSSSFLWASWSDRSYSSVTRGSQFIFIHSHVWVPQATILHCHWKTLTKLKVVNNINVYMYIFIHLAVYLFICVLVAACGI